MSDLNETEVEDTHVQFTCTVKYLSTFIDSVNSFREEGKLVFDGDNIYTKVADPANVGMCISRIKGQALNSLEVVGTDELTVGVKFDRILNCLSGVSSTSDVEVTWPVSASSTHLMRLDVIDHDLQFEISTLNPDTVPDIPSSDPLSYTSRVQVDGTELKKTVNHAGKMAGQEENAVIIETFDETLQVSATDKTAGNFKKQFHNHDPSVDQGLGQHEVKVSLDYLDDIKSLFSEGDVVTIHIKDSHPVRFDIDLDDNGDAQVIYIIAPRLEDK